MTSETFTIKIGFCGEVNSGKSTALQSILRTSFIPDYFGVEDRPVIRVALGAEQEELVVHKTDGSFENVDVIGNIEPSNDISEIYVALTDTYDIGRCELVEIPPLRDGYVSNKQIALISECSIVVWTTIGSQAWRLSEKNIIDDFGALIPKKRILVATRADKFRSDKDRQKLQSRLESETNTYFAAGRMIGVPPSLFDTPEDTHAWAKSGAVDLVDLLADAVAHVELPAQAESDLASVDLFEEEAKAARPRRLSIQKRRSVDRIVRRVSQETSRPISTPVVEDTFDEVSHPEPESVDVSHPEHTPEPEAERTEAPHMSDEDDIAPNVVEIQEDDFAADVEDVAEIIEQTETPDLPETGLAPFEDFIANLNGVIALGVVKIDDPETPKGFHGQDDDVKLFAKFCTLSADAALKLAGFGGTDPNPENEQVVMSETTVAYRVKDNEIVFLAGDASILSAGIARTNFNRFIEFYEADFEKLVEAA